MSKTIIIESKEYVVEPSFQNNKLVELTDEQAQAMAQHWHDTWKLRPTAKLNKIRRMRNARLLDTDYLANSDVTMPENIKTWRQSLRDLPQTYTTESEYDELLARETDKTKDNFGQLTHSVWSKP